MIHKEKENIYIFESTRRYFQTYGTAGLSFDCLGGLQYGYDGTVQLVNPLDKEEDYEPLTNDEKKEIALFMIKRWTEWGNIQ